MAAAALGVGYRVEVRSGQKLGAEGVLLERPDTRLLHELVAVGRAATEFRITPFWSAGAFVELTAVLAGGSSEVDLHGGVLVAVYSYP